MRHLLRVVVVQRSPELSGRDRGLRSRAERHVHDQDRRRHPIEVSNFVTPYYFTEDPLGQPLDHLGKLSQTFGIAKGGYQIRMKGGKVTNVFGARLPESAARRQGSEPRTHVLAARHHGARALARPARPAGVRSS